MTRWEINHGSWHQFMIVASRPILLRMLDFSLRYEVLMFFPFQQRDSSDLCAGERLGHSWFRYGLSTEGCYFILVLLLFSSFLPFPSDLMDHVLLSFVTSKWLEIHYVCSQILFPSLVRSPGRFGRLKILAFLKWVIFSLCRLYHHLCLFIFK
jgi:hypothetical protein